MAVLERCYPYACGYHRFGRQSDILADNGDKVLSNTIFAPKTLCSSMVEWRPTMVRRMLTMCWIWAKLMIMLSLISTSRSMRLVWPM